MQSDVCHVVANFSRRHRRAVVALRLASHNRSSHERRYEFMPLTQAEPGQPDLRTHL